MECWGVLLTARKTKTFCSTSPLVQYFLRRILLNALLISKELWKYQLSCSKLFWTWKHASKAFISDPSEWNLHYGYSSLRLLHYGQIILISQSMIHFILICGCCCWRILSMRGQRYRGSFCDVSASYAVIRIHACNCWWIIWVSQFSRQHKYVGAFLLRFMWHF